MSILCVNLESRDVLAVPLQVVPQHLQANILATEDHHRNGFHSTIITEGELVKSKRSKTYHIMFLGSKMEVKNTRHASVIVYPLDLVDYMNSLKVDKTVSELNAMIAARTLMPGWADFLRRCAVVAATINTTINDANSNPEQPVSLTLDVPEATGHNRAPEVHFLDRPLLMVNGIPRSGHDILNLVEKTLNEKFTTKTFCKSVVDKGESSFQVVHHKNCPTDLTGLMWIPIAKRHVLDCKLHMNALEKLGRTFYDDPSFPDLKKRLKFSPKTETYEYDSDCSSVMSSSGDQIDGGPAFPPSLPYVPPPIPTFIQRQEVADSSVIIPKPTSQSKVPAATTLSQSRAGPVFPPSGPAVDDLFIDSALTAIYPASIAQNTVNMNMFYSGFIPGPENELARLVVDIMISDYLRVHYATTYRRTTYHGRKSDTFELSNQLISYALRTMHAELVVEFGILMSCFPLVELELFEDGVGQAIV